MKLSKKATSLVIFIATISMVGLCWVQYKWLKDTIATNREIFYQKVDLASQLAGQKYEKNKAFLLQLDDCITTRSELTIANENELRAVIDTALSVYNINLPYKYGIYKRGCNESKGLDYVAGTVESDSVLSFECNTTQLNRKYGWTSLTCGAKLQSDSDYHLGIFFPDLNGYLLSSVKDSLVASILFIVLLIGCFSYTVMTIHRQKKLSAIKNDFINNLTHEFKTPIFSIDLASGMLRKSKEVSTSHQLLKYVDVIGVEGRRLKSQVDKVLQMAMVDSGNFKLEKKQLNLHSLLASVADNFRMLIKERKGTLLLKFDAHDPILFADETHLKNIIYNLLDNAQKYTQGPPNITVTTSNGEEGLQISISDNGIGISKEVQKFVFDKFYRVSSGNVHDVKGFGLGLSYVKSVIDAHKGKINLQSRPNTGSIFTLQLPTA